jgi:hypothetical protein
MRTPFTSCRPQAWLLAAIIACALSLGCHRKQQIAWGSVRGKVLLADKPVSAGTVVFDNRELGVSRLAELRPDGSFVEQSLDFPGLPVGEYRVAVTPLPISKGDFVPVAPRKPAAGEPPIPARYRDVETSPLMATVKEGRNPPFVFELSRP